MPLDAGFLEMLTMRADWYRSTGKDQWGNETYAAPVTEECFLISQVKKYGSDDGQNRQEGESLVEVEIIFDAVGIGLNDKVVLGGVTYWVTNVDTPKDEQGVDLMHTVTAQNTRKG